MTAQRRRIDRLLVERGLFESRAKAQAAIEAGLVIADDEVVSKASEEIRIDAALFASAAHPYVSRGGVKLAAALDHFNFNPKGRICLDVGASTGGFTEVLLDRGARRIYAVRRGPPAIARLRCAFGRKSFPLKTPTFARSPPPGSKNRLVSSQSTSVLYLSNWSFRLHLHWPERPPNSSH